MTKPTQLNEQALNPELPPAIKELLDHLTHEALGNYFRLADLFRDIETLCLEARLQSQGHDGYIAMREKVEQIQRLAIACHYFTHSTTEGLSAFVDKTTLYNH